MARKGRQARKHLGRPAVGRRRDAQKRVRRASRLVQQVEPVWNALFYAQEDAARRESKPLNRIDGQTFSDTKAVDRSRIALHLERDRVCLLRLGTSRKGPSPLGGYLVENAAEARNR